MCDCFHLSFPNWHATPAGGRRLQGREPGAEDDSLYDQPSQLVEEKRPRPQGSSPVEEFPEAATFSDSDKEDGADHDLQKKGVKGGRRSGLGSLFDKRSTPKMSKLKEVHSPESEVIVKTAQDGGAEGLIVGGGGKEGIFIKQVVPESPAFKNLCVKEGDQILSATVYFDNVTYEDALQIMEHAQAYKVKLCLKRKPEVPEEDDVHPETIQEEEVTSPEMRGQRRTKRHSDARISWPKFPSLGKGRKKSHFRRSHSTSEAEDQTKLELSPTTSDTDSPVKSQEALKGKKKHKVKLNILKNKGRISAYADQDTDTLTTAPLHGVNEDPTKEVSPTDSPELLEIPLDESPPVYITHQFKIPESYEPKVERGIADMAELESPHHRVELISVDSTLKTTDLTVALAGQDSPTTNMSPDGKKRKKKEKSELKMKIKGKDKSHKQDVKVKSSPKRLQTLGASIEIPDPTANKNLDASKNIASQLWPQIAVNTDTQVTAGKDFEVISASVPPQEENNLPKGELSFDVSDVGILKKSPRRGKEKPKKETEKLSKGSKQKTDTKKSLFKLPTVGFTDIAMEDIMEKTDVKDKEVPVQIVTESLKQDPYDRLSCPSKKPLPKREEMEIPGMEAAPSPRRKKQGIKEPKGLATSGIEELHAETVQMSIDVKSVKEAVSKLPGFKLPQVDMEGVPILEEITMIDANAQRITVKTQGTPTKISDTKTKEDPHRSRTIIQLPNIKAENLVPHDMFTETKVEMNKESKAMGKLSSVEIKTEGHKRENILIPGEESIAEETHVQGHKTKEDAFGWSSGTITGQNKAINKDLTSPQKTKKGKKLMMSFGVAEPDIRIPNVAIDLPKQNLSESKSIGLIEHEEKDDERTSATLKMTPFKSKKSGSYTQNISKEHEMYKKINIEGVELNALIEGADVDEAPCGEMREAIFEGKTTNIELPNLGISMPKVKGPDINFSKSMPDVDVTLPEAQAAVTLPSAKVEIKGPEMESEDFDASSKFKMQKFKLPKFGTGSSNITAEIPEADQQIEFDAELNIPKATVNITAPKIDTEGPDGMGKGSKIKMPSLGISMPKVKGPDLVFSVSKPDVDISLPKGKAEVTLPDIDLSPAKGEVKGPEIDLKVKGGKGSPSKIKMPTVDFPKFGAASHNISVKIPEVDKGITYDREINIPEAGVKITAPNLEIEGPSIDLKTRDIDSTGKGNAFKMPNWGISMPKVKGPDIDFSVSKPDVDLTLTKGKAEVTLPDVDLPPVKVEVKGPEIETEDVDGSSKFKMPKFKLPKFGSESSSITAEVPEVDQQIHFDAELYSPKAKVDITAPTIEVERPFIDLKSTGPDGMGKGSKFKMPSLGISMPKVKGPDLEFSVSKPDVEITLPEAKAEVTLPVVDLPSTKVEVKGPEIETEDVDGSSKFKMPKFKLPKFATGSTSVTAEVPEVDQQIKFDAELNIPETTVDITAPKIEVEGPSIDLKSTGPDGMGKGSKFKMPSLGISMPKVKGPDLEFSVTKPDVEITLPEAKSEVTLPVVDLPSAKVEVKGPEIETEDVDGSYKFKMPKFKLPKFGTGSTSVTAKVPEVDQQIKFDAELNIPETTMDITAPKIEVEGPSIDLKSTGPDGMGKGSKFKMPSLGISMPKVKGPDLDFSVSMPDVDITLPESKAEVTLPDVDLPSARVEVKGPEIETDDFDASSKFKMPKIKLPKFGTGSSSITAEVPEVDQQTTFDAELNIPKATVDIKAPKLEVEGPSVDLKSTGPDGTGKKSKIKMPSLGLSMPKVKGPDIDFSVSKPDVDITLPKGKAEVTIPDVDLPSARVEVKGPEIETEDFDGSSKFKMPKFKLPKFGTGSSSITAEVPEVDQHIKFDAELNIPRATVDIKAPKVEVEGPSIDLKSTGRDGIGKGSKIEMPSLGLSMPKVKGPDLDFNVSKPDVDITLPEAKAEVTLPDVELPSTKVEVKGPEIDVKVKGGKGSPSKFKMPTFKFPKFGAASPNISVEIPEVDKEITFDGEMKIPKGGVEITAPNVEIKGPSIDLKCTDIEGTGKGSTFKMPNLGISMPKVKGPDVDFSVSKPDVDIALPKGKAEVTRPDIYLPSVKVELKGPEIETEDVDGSSKFKMPKFKLPKFGTGSSSVTSDIPEIDQQTKFDAELNIPKATVDIKAPKVEVEGPSIDLKSTGPDGMGKRSKIKMPSLGLSMPKVKGPDIDFNVSKPDVDITLPEAKAEVTLPGVELPSTKAEVKGPEINVKVKGGKGSPSKFKMPTFNFPKFGAASPNISVEIPEVDKEMTVIGEMNIPEAGVEITAPNVEIEGPSIDLKSTDIEGTGKGSKFKMPNLGISVPKVKAPDLDFTVSKPDMDIALAKGKAEVTLPDIDLPSAKVEVKGPEIETEDFDASSKFKMPKFKLPKFGTGSSSITAEVPEVDQKITFDAELNIPKAIVDIKAPKVEVEGPSIALTSTGPDGMGKGSKIKMPSLGLSMPKVKGPDFDFNVSKPDVDITLPEAKAEVTLPGVEPPSKKVEVKGPEIDVKVKGGKGSPSKFKMPTFSFPKFGAASPNISVEIPEVDKEMTVVGEMNIPEAGVEVTAPKSEIEGPSIDLKSTDIEGTGKGSKFKMPNLGISVPKVKAPDLDFTVSKPDMDIALPKGKAEVTLPDVDLPSAEVEVKGPEIETEDFDVSSKFKMPKFKLPKFGTGSSSITAEVPEIDQKIKFDAELNIPKATVDIKAPKVEVEGPSIDLKSTGPDGMGKGSKIKMPSLGLSMPKVKGPDFDFNVSKPDADIALPEAKAEVTLPGVELPSTKAEVKGPEIDVKVKGGKGSPSKFKMPTFNFPKFGAASPNISVEIPEVDKEITVVGEMNIPEAGVEITAPNVEIEGPSIDLKSTDIEGTGKGSKFKMPNLGISVPKVKAPDLDFTVSKPDMDIALPRGKAEVTLPDVELPSAKVEVKGPEIETEDFDASSKFKMPKFKLPKFGTGSSSITAEVPEVDQKITFDAELNIPKATVDVKTPKVEVEGPSIELKSTGHYGMGKGSKIKMPSLGLSMPKVTGPDLDFNVSKPDVDITLPEAKAEVTLPDVELPSTKVEVKGPEIDVKVKGGKGSPSKFKMPTFNFPKFGAASPNISVEIPEVDKEITVVGEMNIPEAGMEITAPNVEIEGPSIDLKSTDIEGTGKGSKFKMPNLGISVPKVRAPDLDFTVSKPDVDITLSKGKAEVTLPDVDRPSAKVDVKGPQIETEDFDVSSKFKMPKFKLPKFGTGSSSVTAEVPEVDQQITFDAELNIPKATMDIKAPKVAVEGPSIDVKSTGPDGMGKGSKIKMPSLGLSMPKVKGPDLDVCVSKPDVDITLPEAKAEVTLPDVELPSTKVEVKGPEIGVKVKGGKGSPSKFKMPTFNFPKFGAASPNISVEIPEVDKEITFDGEMNIPEAGVEIKAPNVEIEGPSIDLKSTDIESTGKGSTFKMPNLGISMPKVKGPDLDFCVSKPDVDITLQKGKAEVTLPDVDLPSAKVEVKGPQIETEDFDASSKFKMPKFKLPKFGTGSSSVTAEVPEVDQEITFDAEVNIPKATVDVKTPKVEVEGPSIDLKSTGPDGMGKGSKIKMPSLGLSMPKVKGPDLDFNVSKPDVDITLPKAKAEVTLPDVELPSTKVEVKGPEIDVKVKGGKGSPSKFKMPTFNFPKFGAASPNISVEIPEVDKEITFDGEMKIPKGGVEITAPNVEIEGPAIDLKSTDIEGTGKGSTFKMPNLGISMPKVKGPDLDFCVSKPDVDITLPKGNAEVTLPDIDLPSAKVEVKGPQIGTEDFDASSKFKMPKFKLPKFGTGSSSVTAEVPEVDQETTFDAELNIPKATVDVKTPKVEVKGPSVDLKSTGPDGMGKGSKIRMPSLGLSMPKVKGPDLDFNVSKPDVDITLPEAKAEVTLPDVELPSTKVEVKGPEIDVKVKGGKGSPSKFKMPTFKFPKFGAASPNISVEIPEVDKEITFDGEMKIPKGGVEITAPNVEIKGPSIDLKCTDIEGTGKGSTFKMPNLGISMPKVKGPDLDFSVSKPDVDITLSKGEAEVTLPDVDQPSAKVDVKGPQIETEDFDGSSKFKMPKFKLPKFGTGSSSVTAEVPEVDQQIKFDAELNIPKATVDIKAPKVEVEGPSIDLQSIGPDGMGKGSKIKMPSLGLSMPKVKGPDLDFSVSKTDADITLPDAKAEVPLPGVELPSTKVDVKGPEIDVKVKGGKGSPSKFKMPTFNFPKFGAASPNISVEIPEVDKEITVDGEMYIPEARVQITAPNVEIEGPSIDLKSTDIEGTGKGGKLKMPNLGISMPKKKGSDLDFSISKPDVDLMLPKGKAEVTLPDVDLPSAHVDIKGPPIETEDFDASSKFKMPKFKLPKFGTGSSSVTAKVPEVDQQIKFDAELKIPKATVDIKAPKVEVEGPSIDLKSTGPDGIGKGSKIKMPSLGLSMPKVKGPDLDFNVSKPNVDITLPEAKAEVTLPDVEIPSTTVEVKGPEMDLKVKGSKGSPSKFKMPTFNFPKFGAASPNISVEIPEVDKDITVDGEMKFPKGGVEITAPNVEIDGPSIDLKSTDIEGTGKGGKFKMPNLGISMPKVKGSDLDFSVSKPDVDLTLPKGKAEVTLPDVDLPSAKVEVKGPEIETEDFDASSKSKMPKFKLPKFGTGSSSITVEVPEVDQQIKFDAELKISKATVDIEAPKVEVEGPSIDIKSTGPDGMGKGSKIKMPSLGLSMPKVKGPDLDFTVSKPDVDITLPEAKAEVILPGVELPSTKVDVKGPEIDVKVKGGKGSPSKFKMPTLKFPKFGAASPNISVEIPEVDKNIAFDGEMNIPQGGVEITAPNVAVEGPSIDVKTRDIEGTGKGSTFKMPNLGISMPKVKGPDLDFTVSKPDMDITLPEAKAEVTLPDVECPLMKLEVKGPKIETEDFDGSSKFKMPQLADAEVKVLKEPGACSVEDHVTVKQSGWSFPSFSFSKTHDKEQDINATIVSPQIDIRLLDTKTEIHPSDVEVKKQTNEILAAELPAVELETNLKKTRFSLPRFSFSKPSINAHETDANLKELDCSLPRHKMRQMEVSEVEGEGTEFEGHFEVTTPSLSIEASSVNMTKTIGTYLGRKDIKSKKPETATLPELDMNMKQGKEIETCEPNIPVGIKVLSHETGAPNTDSQNPDTASPVTGFKEEAVNREPEVRAEPARSPGPVGPFSPPPEESPESPDEDLSTACSLQSSDAFADASSTATSEHTGVSFTSPSKVTVKYSSPDAAVELGEVHSNIITSTTRSAQISFEPNLPEKITILSSGVSSSSVDTLKLESDQIHVIRSNIQATPQVLTSTILNNFDVQSPLEMSMDPEFREAVSWSVEEPRGFQGITRVERHITNETSSQQNVMLSRREVVITQQLTRRADQVEPISDETACSIQRLRDTVHSEKMRFFDGAQP